MQLGHLSSYLSLLRLPALFRISSSLSTGLMSSPPGLPSALASSSNLRLIPPIIGTPLPASAAILFIPRNLVGSVVPDLVGPAERWTREGFFLLEVQMDDDGRDLEAEGSETDTPCGWHKVLTEGRQALAEVDGIDSAKPVGIIAHSPPVRLLLHLSTLPPSQTLFSALVLPGSTSLIPSLPIPIQSHLPQLPWEVPAYDESAEVSLGDANTFVYPAAETRDWMCPALGDEGGWRREDAVTMYRRGGEFLRKAAGNTKADA